MFESGEDLEFQQKDSAKAIAAFGELSRSKDPVIRAGALLRLGRSLRKAQQPRAALDVYQELEQMGATPIGGLPAELLARHARCVLLDQLKRTTEVKREAGALYADLHNGRPDTNAVPVKWIPKIDRPILLLHNSTDKLALAEWQEDIRKAGGDKLEYVEVVDPNPNHTPGEGHSYVGVETDAVKAVLDWLKKKDFLPHNVERGAK